MRAVAILAIVFKPFHELIHLDIHTILNSKHYLTLSRNAWHRLEKSFLAVDISEELTFLIPSTSVGHLHLHMQNSVKPY